MVSKKNNENIPMKVITTSGSIIKGLIALKKTLAN